MLGSFRDGAFKFGAPRCNRLPRPRIDEVERVTREDRARHRYGVERFLCRVQTAEFLQHRVVECLYAERDAIDAGRAIAAEAGGFDAGRIGFERDFDIRRDGPVLADSVEDRLHGLRLHQRRRAAAKKNGRDSAARHTLRGRGKLGFESAQEARLVDAAVTDVAVEIAVGAFRQTERPVHVNGKRRLVG